MTYDEFLGQVRQRAGLTSSGEAERATQAVLETLAERLEGGEPRELAAQLPPEIGRYLQRIDAGLGEPLPLDDFFQLVSLREGVDPPNAKRHTRAVMAVLKDAVSSGELGDVVAQLPEDYVRLFAESEGTMLR